MGSTAAGSCIFTGEGSSLFASPEWAAGPTVVGWTHHAPKPSPTELIFFHRSPADRVHGAPCVRSASFRTDSPASLPTLQSSHLPSVQRNSAPRPKSPPLPRPLLRRPPDGPGRGGRLIFPGLTSSSAGLDEFCQWIDYQMESTRVRSTGQELWCFRILTLALTLKVSLKS